MSDATSTPESAESMTDTTAVAGTNTAVPSQGQGQHVIGGAADEVAGGGAGHSTTAPRLKAGSIT